MTPILAGSEWLIGLLLASFLAVVIRVLAKKLTDRLPEGRIKRLLTRKF